MTRNSSVAHSHFPVLVRSSFPTSFRNSYAITSCSQSRYKSSKVFVWYILHSFSKFTFLFCARAQALSESSFRERESKSGLSGGKMRRVRIIPFTHLSLPFSGVMNSLHIKGNYAFKGTHYNRKTLVIYGEIRVICRNYISE